MVGILPTGAKLPRRGSASAVGNTGHRFRSIWARNNALAADRYR